MTTKYALTTGTKWLSGKIETGIPMPTLTENASMRYEYDTFDQADDIITNLMQNGYYNLANSLEVVEV